MESRISSFASQVLLVMAASSLMSMLCLMQIDGIVHRDLYRYGLRFDVQWAQPYWILTAIMFGIGWFNIIMALIIHVCMLYQLAKRRKETRIASFQREVVKSEMPLPHKLGREEKVEIEKQKEIGARKHQTKRTTSTKTKTRPRKKRRKKVRF